MPYFTLVNNLEETKKYTPWKEASSFKIKNKFVNKQGKCVSEIYTGHKYQLIGKKEYEFSNLKSIGKIFCGVLAIICSFGIAIFFKQIKRIFTQRKKSIHCAILISSPNLQKQNDSISIPIKAHTAVNEGLIKGTSTLLATKKIQLKNVDHLKEINKFKDELEWFSVKDKGIQQIAIDLFRIAPKFLELEEVIEIIFQHADRDCIPGLLDAILATNSSFALSPFNKIRRTIVERDDLTNNSLNRMLKEQALDDCKEKVIACYDLAHQINHPSLYRIPKLLLCLLIIV